MTFKAWLTIYDLIMGFAWNMINFYLGGWLSRRLWKWQLSRYLPQLIRKELIKNQFAKSTRKIDSQKRALKIHFNNDSCKRVLRMRESRRNSMYIWPWKAARKESSWKSRAVLSHIASLVFIRTFCFVVFVCRCKSKLITCTWYLCFVCVAFSSMAI